MEFKLQVPPHRCTTRHLFRILMDLSRRGRCACRSTVNTHRCMIDHRQLTIVESLCVCARVCVCARAYHLPREENLSFASTSESFFITAFRLVIEVRSGNRFVWRSLLREINSPPLRMTGKSDNFTADNPEWIRTRMLRAQTRTDTGTTGTSHSADVDRSNVLQLVRLRRSGRKARAEERERQGGQ
jgi:hypothetical protein